MENIKNNEVLSMSVNSERVKKSQEKTDAIMLRPQKADGKRIRDAAAAAGTTVSGYILSAVYERMDSESKPTTCTVEVDPIVYEKAEMSAKALNMALTDYVNWALKERRQKDLQAVRETPSIFGRHSATETRTAPKPQTRPEPTPEPKPEPVPEPVKEEPKPEPSAPSANYIDNPLDFHKACVFAIVFPDVRFVRMSKDLGNDLQAMKTAVETNGAGASDILNAYVKANGEYKVELLETLYEGESDDYMRSRCNYWRQKEAK